MDIKGLDISKYQNGLKMSDVKRCGYEFVILRCGFTSSSDGKTHYVDPCFEAFCRDARAEGIPVGAYFYSCATTVGGGMDDANWVYKNCLYGKRFDYPIYIDLEEPKYQTSKYKTTQAAFGFIQRIQQLGFKAGIYTARSWYENDNNVINSVIDSLDASKWVANWSTSKPKLDIKHWDLWQSGTSRIGSCIVDVDHCYKAFTLKTVQEIAAEVIAGKWGTGAARKKALTDAGYNYAEVQAAVNELMARPTK